MGQVKFATSAEEQVKEELEECTYISDGNYHLIHRDQLGKAKNLFNSARPYLLLHECAKAPADNNVSLCDLKQRGDSVCCLQCNEVASDRILGAYKLLCF